MDKDKGALDTREKRLGTQGLKAVSGVVAAVILALALAIAVAAFMTLASFIQDLASKSIQLLEYKAQSAAIVQSITGWWLQNSTTLTINLTNNAAYTLILTTISIIYNDTSIQVLDKGSQVTVTKANGETTTTSLPLPLPPTTTINITVNVANKTIKQVTITVSASPIAVAIPLKNYYQVYPPVTANITPPPEWSVTLLPNLTWSSTTPYAYTTIGYTVDYKTYYPTAYTVYKGTYLSGTLPDSVNASDGVYFEVVSEGTKISYDIYTPSSVNISIGVNESTVSAQQALALNDNTDYLIVKAWPAAFYPRLYLSTEPITLQGTTYLKAIPHELQQPVVYINESIDSTYDRNNIVYGPYVYRPAFIYPLAPYRGYTIPAGTWIVAYHVWWVDNTDADCWSDYSYASFWIDIYVVKTNGTIVELVSRFAQLTLTATDLNNPPNTPIEIDVGDNFTGYTIQDDDLYLVIEIGFEAFLDSGYNLFGQCIGRLGDTWSTGTYNFYLFINSTSAYIYAPSTWPSTYAVDIVFSGFSNKASDWVQLIYGLDIKASIVNWTSEEVWVDDTNVTGYAQLYDYISNVYRASAPGYITIGPLTSSDSFYSEDINETLYELERFRDPATGEWRIHLHLERTVDWNEGFKIYIDYVPFNVTFVSEYTVDTVFTITGVEPGNVASLNLFVNVTHNETLSSFGVYLWNFNTGSWDLVYSAVNSSRIVANISISVDAAKYVDTVNGIVKVRLVSINSSENAWPFIQAVDELKTTIGYYGAPALVVGTAGTKNLYVYKYISGNYSLVSLPLTLDRGLAVAANGYTVYIVYGGNRTNFTLVDLATGSWMGLGSLPEPSILSHLVVLNETHVFYMPAANTSPTYYLYDNTTSTWYGPYTAPLEPPIYACTLGGSGAIVCANATHLVAFTPTGALLWNTQLPLIATTGQEIIGLVYDAARDWYIILYQTGDIRIYSGGKWYQATPTPPPSAGYSILLQQDPDRLYYLKFASRELYTIYKKNLQLKEIS